MAERLPPFDPAEYLETDEDVALYLNEAFATGDASFIAHSLGVVARAKGMTQIAKETGLARETLYQSFSDKGNPTLKSTIAIMQALGVDLTAISRRRNQETPKGC